MNKRESLDIDWRLTTWEGSRREQLRRTARLTLRQRLQAVEEMAELSRRLGRVREKGSLQDADSSRRGDES